MLQQVPPLEVVEFSVSSAWEGGHVIKDCPNNRVMIITEDGGYDSTSEGECELLAENDEFNLMTHMKVKMMTTRLILLRPVTPL